MRKIINKKIIFNIIKANSSVFLIFISMFIIWNVVAIYKSDLFNKLQESELLIEPIKSFDKETIKFISQHDFSNKKINFRKFIENLADHNFAIITKVLKSNEIKTDTFRKTQYKIKGYFWHDKFVFKFIDEVQNFHPEFLKLLNIDIDKFSKANVFKPSIKLELICEIFQKF